MTTMRPEQHRAICTAVVRFIRQCQETDDITCAIFFRGVDPGCNQLSDFIPG